MSIRIPVLALFLILSSHTLDAQDAVSSAAERIRGAAVEIFSGQSAQARLEIQETLVFYRAQKDLAGEGMCLVLLGLADVASEDREQAVENLEKGASLLHQAGDPFSAFIPLWMVASLDTTEANLELIVERHRRALAMLDKAASATTFSLEGFRVLAPAIGFDPSQLGPLLQNAEMFKPILLAMGDTMARDSLGHIYTKAGELEKAEVELERAASTGAMFGKFFDFSIQTHLGNLRRRQWKFDRAREHYLKAHDGIVAMPMIPGRDEWVQVETLGHLAEIELLSGRTDEALAWNDRALELVRKSKNRRREAWILSDRGDLLLRAGRLEDAKKILDEGLAIAEAIDDRFLRGSIRTSMGSLLRDRGDYGQAAATLEKAIEILQEDQAIENEAAAWLLLAEVYDLLGVAKSADESIVKARELAKKSNFRLAMELTDSIEAFTKLKVGDRSTADVIDSFGRWWALPETQDFMLPKDFRLLIESLVTLDDKSTGATLDPKAFESMPATAAIAYFIKSKQLVHEGKWAEARVVLQTAEKLNPSSDLRAAYLAMIGATYWRENNAADAIQHFERALQSLDATADDVKVDDLLAGYLGGYRHWYPEIIIKMLLQKGQIEAAFDLSERARSRAFLHSIGNTRLQPAHGAAAPLVAEAEALRRSIADWEHKVGLEPAVRKAELANARDRYQVVLQRLKVSNPEYASLTSVEPLRVAEVQRQLPQDTTLISYFVSLNEVNAWVIDRDHVQHIALPDASARIDAIVCWATSLGGDELPDDARAAQRSVKPVPSMCQASATAEEAYGLLFEPLRSKVRNSRILIVPHARLHYVPFAALRDPESRHYLIEDYTIAYVPSASALRFIQEKESPVTGTALIIGDPQASIVSMERLSGAAREAASIATLFGVEPKLGDQATESLLYGLNGKIDLVHISAHGEFASDHPMFSRIALARDDRHDGFLDVHEVLSDVDLSGVNLVVLSACRTARGTRSGGDEIVGLTRAVLYAGAPGVISTLWDIDDEAAADLIEEFYRRLLTGLPVGDALRQAQLVTMKRKPYEDPRYWAAFSLSGIPAARWSKAAEANGEANQCVPLNPWGTKPDLCIAELQ
jgi:CHAT domain-containing protein/Tfp pilus assembly protein PilF